MIFIIIVNILLGFKLYWDKRAKNKGRIINHAFSATVDTLIYILSAWWLFGVDAGGWIISALGYRWIFFDLLFNKMNGWKWNHYGLSSRIDRFMFVVGKWHIVIKLTLFLSGIALMLFV